MITTRNYLYHKCLPSSNLFISFNINKNALKYFLDMLEEINKLK